MPPASLQQEIGKRKPFEDPSQEAYLNVQRTAAVLSAQFATLFKGHGLTEPQYNLLRILRGATLDPAAGGRRSCHEIAEQMISPVPDVTRLVDRLEESGLATRERGEDDRRVVYVRASAKGLELLAALDGLVMDMHRRQMSHITPESLATLSRLLTLARHPEEREHNAAGEPRAVGITSHRM